MKVISSLLPAKPEEVSGGRPAVLMAFDTLVDEKRLVVGITVGRLDGPQLTDVRVSPIGQLIIDRCGEHMDLNYPDGVVVVAGVAQVGSAKQRVRKVLSDAPDQAFLLLVCADDKVYDAAFPALNVNFQAANVGPQ